MTLPKKPRILLIEDTPVQARLLLDHLSGGDWIVEHVETGAEALAALTRTPPDVLLLDIMLPDMSGMDILRKVRADAAPVGVIVVTSNGSVTLAVDAMRAGADDFLVKPFTRERFLVTLRNVIDHLTLSREVEVLRENLGIAAFAGFVGSSAAMQRVYRRIEASAASNATVFITGESGTGKELAAEALHRNGPRARGRFVALNCGAIPRDLMESEIFGHVKGAFTGAVADREGAAATADGGTLFLDEICEMDPNLQTKLLRFLQSGVVQRVGDDRRRPVDVRIVCATNRDPLAEVRAGRFREDLYYRLHVIPVRMPALRERGGDVLELADHYLARITAEERKAFRGFSPDAAQALLAYPWPGNVRELINVLRNIVVLNDGPEVTLAMLPPPLAGEGEPAGPPGSAAPLATTPARASAEAAPRRPTTEDACAMEAIEPLWQVERRAIERAIQACGGNVPRAAALLRVSPSTIYRKKQIWDEESS
ncbi:sigma-54-dependent transcriptional regulator [Pararhodospirillum oryzae]|uniref:Sigma-54-dependent Fis family transcriptional regulator n=1 Tax=Pararhodospirillum oryzae TaxID=478448 RepID=A0A512H709_9PROT|nr:sigma-54 dependent transcriptional regulator [Pararhodospirillum oryzae]GEO81243.1 sigma-54-dependent Fis family transcriptional regulator [Pararhodospirillum oryzae]